MESNENAETRMKRYQTRNNSQQPPLAPGDSPTLSTIVVVAVAKFNLAPLLDVAASSGAEAPPARKIAQEHSLPIMASCYP